jgi:hypothetical protein
VTTDLAIALISGAVALAAGCLAVWGQFRSTRLSAELEDLRLAEQRRMDSEKALSRYREPLARSAYDLQSRLYNILEQGLIEAYFNNGEERERTYVVENTTFLFAQYLAWTEIIRRDIQFIDLGQDEQTRELARLQDDIYSLLQTDGFGRHFRIFAGEQRAIGESMICDGVRGLECVGYAAFLNGLATFQESLLEPIREDVRSLSARLPEAHPRLVALQNALIDLLEFLDPDFLRFPKERRWKVLS